MLCQKTLFRLFSFLVLVLLALPSLSWSKDGSEADADFKARTNPSVLHSEHFDINTIDCIMTNDGVIVDDRVLDRSGMEWPGGSGMTIDFNSGLWLAGIGHDDQRLYTACSEYFSELVPGHWGEDPEDERFRIYKINRDGSGDWDDWPVDQGAPVDENGQPLLLGDQTLWWVANDGDSAQHRKGFKTPPIDVEIHYTVFGFNSGDLLDNVMFVMWKLINRSTQQYDSCFVGLWDDPDLGDRHDDFVGCDIALSMGYCYNGWSEDAIYGFRPPALGFDFLRGPEAPGGSEQFLSMTGFAYFFPTPWSHTGPPEMSSEVYWSLNGYTKDGTPFTDHHGNVTRFPLAGDPVAGSGHLDRRYHDDSGERYFLMSSGPFTFAPGDTQMVVGAKIVAQGGNNIHSIATLRYYSRFVQNFFNNGFAMPSPPEPDVKAACMDREIVLTWHEGYEMVESYDTGDYQFQGYNIYQGASEDGPWTRLATYDIADDHGVIFDQVIDPETGFVLEQPIQYGCNSGIQRYTIVNEDAFSETPLSNYSRYFFAVTSYAVTEGEDIAPRAVESTKKVITVNGSLDYVLPQEEFERRPMAEVGEVLEITHVGEPLSDGRVEAIVLDPMALTGHTYQVTFFTESHMEDEEEVIETFWKATDMDIGQDVVPRWSNQSGDEDYPIVDGLMIKVIDIEDGIKAIVQVANANGPLADQPGWPDELADEIGEPYGGNNVWHDGCTHADSLTSGRWYVSAGGGQGELDRMARNIKNAKAHDFEMRFTEEGGFLLWWFDDFTWADVPFEAWDIGSATYDDTSDDVRCIPGGYSVDGNTGYWIDFSYMDPALGFPASDWTYFNHPDNDAGTYEEFVGWLNSGTITPTWYYNCTEVLARIIICSLAEDPGPENVPATGTVIRWITNKHNSPADTFAFTAPAPSTGIDVQKAALDEINVVPNPFFGYNPQGGDPDRLFVTFTHLPESGVKIRIYALDGTLVKIIDDRKRALQGTLGTSIAYWYLRNQGENLSNLRSGLQVASGMYLAHVEVQGVGDKVLKLAVFVPEERLRIY
jgi:hypothetical protein